MQMAGGGLRLLGWVWGGGAAFGGPSPRACRGVQGSGPEEGGEPGTLGSERRTRHSGLRIEDNQALWAQKG